METILTLPYDLSPESAKEIEDLAELIAYDSGVIEGEDFSTLRRLRTLQRLEELRDSCRLYVDHVVWDIAKSVGALRGHGISMGDGFFRLKGDVIEVWGGHYNGHQYGSDTPTLQVAFPTWYLVDWEKGQAEERAQQTQRNAKLQEARARSEQEHKAHEEQVQREVYERLKAKFEPAEPKRVFVAIKARKSTHVRCLDCDHYMEAHRNETGLVHCVCGEDWPCHIQ